MADLDISLKEAMSIPGAIGVALVDYTSGMTLGAAGGGRELDLEVAAAGNTEVVRAKMRTIAELGLKDGIEDILITLDNQYHLLRPLKSSRGDGLSCTWRCTRGRRTWRWLGATSKASNR